MRALPLGSVIGAVAGLVFVLVNAGAVPGALVWRIAGAVAFAAVVWFVVRGPQLTPAPPSREALRNYGFSVVAMLVALPVGAGIISNVLDMGPGREPVPAMPTRRHRSDSLRHHHRFRVLLLAPGSYRLLGHRRHLPSDEGDRHPPAPHLM